MSGYSSPWTGWACGRTVVCALALMAALATAPARAQMANLRITEVDPHHNKVEITNFNGGIFQLTSELPTPYNFDFNNVKKMGIVPGFLFYPNAIWVFEYPDLRTDASDCWLYANEAFDNPSAVIHGVQYGTPPPERCNSEIAGLAGKWPGKSASAPVPPPDCTLAWDGEGYTPLDWYIDSTPTMGAPNDTAPGVVDEPFKGVSAKQTFETPALGDQVTALKGWTMAAAGGRFGARFVADVNGRTGVRTESGSVSRRWLRIRDTDAAGANTFSSPAVALGPRTGYRCVFYVNQETAPTAAAGALPALVIQNATGTDLWTDAWGVRFKSTGLEAAVLTGGGAPGAANLVNLSGAAGVGQWVKIELQVDLTNGALLASANGGNAVRLPIKPAGDPLNLRLTYQGSGAGNTQNMLLDDVEFSAWTHPRNAVEAWGEYR